MANITFKRASKTQARLRLALIGPAGSGKTMTALQIATALGGPIAVMDTEHGSASKYASLFQFDGFEPISFHPQVYIDAIRAAEDNGYRVLIIDSLSHAWSGKDGALELVDKAAKRSQSSNNFTAWRDVTPLHNSLVDALMGARIHIIATVRAKMEYVMEKDNRGQTVVRKIGLQPVQRDGLEYEFDVVGDLNQDNDLIVGKTRCPALSGKVFSRAGADVACILSDWLSDGAPAPAPEAASYTPPHTNSNGTVQPKPLIGPAQNVEAKYNGKGQLAVRFTLNDQVVIYAGAPSELTYMENGDQVIVTGKPDTIKGQKAIRAVDVVPDFEPDLWIERAKQAQTKAQTDIDELFPEKLSDAPVNDRRGKVVVEDLPL